MTFILLSAKKSKVKVTLCQHASPSGFASLITSQFHWWFRFWTCAETCFHVIYIYS